MEILHDTAAKRSERGLLDDLSLGLQCRYCPQVALHKGMSAGSILATMLAQTVLQLSKTSDFDKGSEEASHIRLRGFTSSPRSSQGVCEL